MHQPHQPVPTAEPPSIYGFIAAAIAIFAILSGTAAVVGAIGTCIVGLQLAHAAITTRR